MSDTDITVLNYAIENAIYFVDVNDKPSISSLNSIDIDSNKKTFIDYHLKLQNSNQYFVDKSKGKMLVVKSWYVLKNELNLN